MTTCSAAWADPGLPAWGTAARASFWVGMEQAGPWGTKAATQSRFLDPEVGAALDSWCLDRGGRFLLLRQPHEAEKSGATRGGAPAGARRVFVMGNLSGQPWLGTASIADPARLPGLLAEAGVHRAQVRPEPFERHPAILTVCTNGKRDQCCARGGLALVRDLRDDHPGQIWECSHLGGHRFAPTALLWPTGQVLGRLDAASAATGLLLAERDLVWGGGPIHDRGRSHLDPARQAAEAWVRARIAPKSPTAVTSEASGDDIVVTCQGQAWRLRIETREAGQRAESCGAAAIRAAVLVPTVISGP